MSKYKALDALGNEIIIGTTYGYTMENRGATYVRLGEALNITPKGYITILIKKCIVQYTVEGNRSIYENMDKFEKTSIKPIKLFPICN